MYKLTKIKDKIFFFTSLALFLSALGTVIYYIVSLSSGFFHSDCTDSLYWANASIESGQIIADNFRYAAILPFSANLYMIPLIRIFGMTMKTQIISMAFFALLYTASLLWLFRSLRFSWSFGFSGTAFMLMLLSSSIKMREIMWEHVIYYSLALLFFNCILSLALRIFDAWQSLGEQSTAKAKIRLGIYASLFCFLTLCLSTNGLPVIVMSTLPVFVGIVLHTLLRSKEKLLSKSNIGRLFCAVAGAVFSVLGLLVLKLISKGVTADYTNLYSQFSPIENWHTNLFKFPMHFINLIGFNNERVDFASLDGISNLLIIATFAVLLLTPFVALLFYKKIKNDRTKVLLLSYAVLFGATMFIFSCGNTSNVAWRLVPLVGASGIATLCVLRELLMCRSPKQSKCTEGSEHSYIPLRIASAIILLIFLFSLNCFSNIVKIPRDYGKDRTLVKLTEALEENGLTYGYATFWNSQAITLLSDGDVKCREILANAKDGAKTDYYQSSFDWYEPQDGVNEYFVLLSEKEYLKVCNHGTWEEWMNTQHKETIHPIDGYIIFVFDGYLKGIAP